MNLQISHLRNLYLSGALTPTNLVKQLDAEIGTEDTHHIWIRRLRLEELLDYAKALEGKDIASFPLYGIPFAIKDNIDLVDIPTTAGCPEYAYTPTKSASVVQKLIDAGAIPIGKTNLDQFATGLVGTRSPYGACKNSINPEYISGGSSAGSAVAVALGMTSFSLGTDTAGSGRIPAAFNNLIGYKPSLGLLSTSGVVPACRTLDCVSIFSNSPDDAAVVLQSAQGFDIEDAYSRQIPVNVMPNLGPNFTFGVPRPEQLAFFDNPETPILFKQAIENLEKIGGKAIEIDFSPFLETAQLLYEGPWVAERYAAIREFFDSRPEAIFPVTRQIIGNANKFNAADTYTAFYKLKSLQRKAEMVWNEVDVIITPTAGTIYTIAEVEENPIQTNTNLGYYTNFMNLLDLTAVAVPTGFQSNSLGFGITLCAPAFSDEALLNLANRLSLQP
ncbi:MAG: allophanate hydrolase [Betaproteobacteria bacterium HGW-Betaproteobacteria-20]|nr:MAG: allophanate hydrolase [Betaproteobacteria bacterium HGW-Betaproteobacteria-20]